MRSHPKPTSAHARFAPGLLLVALLALAEAGAHASLQEERATAQEACARLRGRVEGARVAAEVVLFVEGERAARRAPLDASGSFEFAGLPAARLFVASLAWSYFDAAEFHSDLDRSQRHRYPLARELSLAAGELREVHWQVPPPTRVRGRALLLPERTPFVGELELRREDRDLPAGETIVFGLNKAPDLVRTRSDGTFELGALMPGRWWIGAPFQPELTFRPLARAFEIGAGQQELELLVEVERTSFVTGRVLSASGRIAKRARVDAPGGEDLIFSDLEGNFRFPLVEPGANRLQARLRGHAASEWIPVAPGQTEVMLRLRRASRILVRAFDAHGVGLEPELWALDESSGECLGAGEPLAGELRIEELPPGRYTLLAWNEAGVAWQHGVELAEGESKSVTLVLETPAAELEVHAAPGMRACEVRVFQNGVPVARSWLRTGSRRLGVPAGTSELRVLEPDGSLRRRVVEAQRGAVARLDLALASPASEERKR